MNLYGFRVVALGSVSAGFTRALRRLAERGYVDARCTILKTAPGRTSGITHAGGRYVHADNASAADVVAEMRRQGIEPPPFPFIVTPGPGTLFHEWGHHVERLWSGGDRDVLFSFRWFSQFYEIRRRRFEPGEVRVRGAGHADEGDPIRTRHDANDAVNIWYMRTAELFATLFEEWMGAEAKHGIDHCAPADLNDLAERDRTDVRLVLRAGINASEVRARTYELFARGQDQPVELPEVREDLFGAHTTAAIERFRVVLERLRTEAR